MLSTVVHKIDQATLAGLKFLLDREAGSSGYGTEAVLITIVAILAAVMMGAGDAIGGIIKKAIAAIGG
jgi:hypothetical protein